MPEQESNDWEEGLCEMCEEVKSKVKTVMISPGRDYPGVGGPPSPPEYAYACEDCILEAKEGR